MSAKGGWGKWQIYVHSLSQRDVAMLVGCKDYTQDEVFEGNNPVWRNNKIE